MASEQSPSLITEQIKKLIGAEGAPVSVEVEKSTIRKVLAALQDTDPFWQELGAARIGTEINVPPAYFMSIAPKGPDVKIEIPLSRNVAGGEEWQFFSPIRLKIGQTISAKRRLSDIQEKQGKSGPMVLITFEDRFQSESGQVLALRRTTSIRL